VKGNPFGPALRPTFRRDARRRLRGITLIEMLVVGTIMLILSGALLQVFIGVHSAHRNSQVIPPAQDDLAALVNRIGGVVRQAQLFPVGTEQDAAIATAGAKMLGYYTSCNAISCTEIEIAESGGTVTSSSRSARASFTLATDVQLAFSYFVSAGGGYNSTSATLVPYDPLVHSRKAIVAVEIAGTLVRDGATASYSTTVRLRNAPKKSIY
jgi:Tfp pilus assembly protein PilW